MIHCRGCADDGDNGKIRQGSLVKYTRITTRATLISGSTMKACEALRTFWSASRSFLPQQRRYRGECTRSVQGAYPQSAQHTAHAVRCHARRGVVKVPAVECAH
eukprot:Opistho-2@78385